MSVQILMPIGALLSKGLFSEGGPAMQEIPTLPTGEALILMFALVTLLVLALYLNTITYQLPEGIGSHAEAQGDAHEMDSQH